jgi:DNA-binding CsgD family transcriptional regulator
VTTQPDPTLSYADIAALAGLKVETVRGYATTRKADSGFPDPVTPAGSPSPRFEVADALAWVESRHQAGQLRGRPRSSPRATRVRLTLEQSGRLRELLQQARISQQAIADDLGLSRRSVAKRLDGLSTWDRHELEHVARRLKVKYSVLVSQPNVRRRRRDRAG